MGLKSKAQLNLGCASWARIFKKLPVSKSRTDRPYRGMDFTHGSKVGVYTWIVCDFETLTLFWIPCLARLDTRDHFFPRLQETFAFLGDFLSPSPSSQLRLDRCSRRFGFEGGSVRCRRSLFFLGSFLFFLGGGSSIWRQTHWRQNVKAACRFFSFSFFSGESGAGTPFWVS